MALLMACCSTAASALDRHAFTFTKYDLDVRIEPEQQRFAVRGKITLRNDSGTPQKNAVLQISSSLNWSSIRFQGKPLEFISQTYTSDIDHTGALRQAIVSLPHAIAAKENLELELGYEGLILLDSTRLKRIGVPAEVANRSDWDQIGQAFTAIRGVGHVTWYPIGTEAVNFSEGNSVSTEISRWKQREAESAMQVNLCLLSADNTVAVMNDATPGASHTETENAGFSCSMHSFPQLGDTIPTCVIGNYLSFEHSGVEIRYLKDHKSGADNYTEVLNETAPFVSRLFGEPLRAGALRHVLDLPDSEAEPFESGNTLLIPLMTKDSNLFLSAIQQLVHASFWSPRAWIREGVARYTQLALLRERGSRQTVVEFLQGRQDALLASETDLATVSEDDSAGNSLLNSDDDFLVQTKAGYVWWMLGDIVGDQALRSALRNYRAGEDKLPDYLQKLIEAQSHRDLEWFFDDWVYRDRGLPDFRIVSVFPRALVSGGYMVTVLVENRGDAGGEVPVTVLTEHREVSQRLEVQRKSRASVRIPVGTLPIEAIVNDGSVPESDISNNRFKIQPPITGH